MFIDISTYNVIEKLKKKKNSKLSMVSFKPIRREDSHRSRNTVIIAN